MVNTCCVEGCGRTSKLSPHLNFYTFPKDKARRLQWLNAIGRDDISNTNPNSTSRVCSRHFDVNCLKKRNLTPDAVPTLCLSNPNTGIKEESLPHHDIICDSCKNTILGFRYKCVTCPDYDLCPKCEMLETHPGHYMLRIPKPMKFKIADDLIKKWRAFFKAEHVSPECAGEPEGCSSDDEPIINHVKKHTQYDSGIELSEEIKEVIRGEVTRVLTLKPEERKKRKKEKRKGDGSLSKACNKSKKAKLDKTDSKSGTEAGKRDAVPEVAFADVNEYKELVDVKSEDLVPAGAEDTEFGPPLMNVRLSDDLSELVIEMANNSVKGYKYP